MSHPRNDEPIGISKPDLIAAWAILENLTVSLDQIGGFFGEHAPPAALNKSLGDYFTPALVEAIGHARARLARYIAEDEAEALSEQEIPYWNYKGVKATTGSA